MDKVAQNKYIDLLKKKGVRLPCPRCGRKDFTIVDGFFNQTIQNDFGGITIGGPSIPSIVTTCNNCGFISQHAIGAIEKLDSNKDKKF